MEKYTKLKKLGRGTYGDVVLIKRLEDQKVLSAFSKKI